MQFSPVPSSDKTLERFNEIIGELDQLPKISHTEHEQKITKLFEEISELVEENSAILYTNHFESRVITHCKSIESNVLIKISKCLLKTFEAKNCLTQLISTALEKNDLELLKSICTDHESTIKNYFLEHLESGSSDQTPITKLIIDYELISFEPNVFSIDMYSALSHFNIDFNSRKFFTYPPLYYAVVFQQHDLFNLILADNGNVAVLFDDARAIMSYLNIPNPVETPTSDQMILIVKALAARGAAIPSIAPTIQDNLLYRAICSPHYTPNDPYVNYLMTLGFNLHYSDVSLPPEGKHNFMTFVSSQCNAQNWESKKIILNRLFDLGFKVDTRNDTGTGRCSLTYALESKFFPLIFWLLEKGANPGTAHAGVTCLELFLHEPNYRKIALKLIKKGVVVNYRMIAEKQTPLTFAIKRGDQELIDHILKNPKVDVNLQDGEKKPPIAHAFANNNYPLVTQLLTKGAYAVDCHNKDGETLLEWTFQNKDYKDFTLFKDLVDKQRLSLDFRNRSGQTFLYSALTNPTNKFVGLTRNQTYAKEYIDFAMSRGVDVYAKTPDGSTPLHAMLEHYPELVSNIKVTSKKLLYLNDAGFCALDIAFKFKRIDFIRQFISKFTVTGDLFEATPADQLTVEGLGDILRNLAQSHDNIPLVLECALLLNIRQTSIDLLQKIGKERFASFFAKIVKKYPEMSRDYWLNHLIYNKQEHLLVVPVNTTIPEAPPVDIKKFIEIFDQIDTSNPASINYISPQKLAGKNPFWTYDYLKEKLNIYIDSIIHLKKREGIKNPATFYPPVLNNLRHLLLKYEELDSKKEQDPGANEQRLILVRLVVHMAAECSTRWKTGGIENFLAYFETDGLLYSRDFQDSVIYELNKVRQGILQTMAGPEAHRRALHIKQLLPYVPVYGLEEMKDFQDFLTVPDAPSELETVAKFWNYYNPAKLCHFLQDLVEEHLRSEKLGNDAHEISVFKWYRTHLDDWKKEVYEESEISIKKIELIFLQKLQSGEVNAAQCKQGILMMVNKIAAKHRLTVPSEESKITDVVNINRFRDYQTSEMIDLDGKLSLQAALRLLSQIGAASEVAPGTLALILEAMENKVKNDDRMPAPKRYKMPKEQQ